MQCVALQVLLNAIMVGYVFLVCVHVRVPYILVVHHIHLGHKLHIHNIVIVM